MKQVVVKESVGFRGVLFVLVAFFVCEDSSAISKVVACQEARTSPNEVELVLFSDGKSNGTNGIMDDESASKDAKNGYKLIVNFVGPLVSDQVALEVILENKTPADAGKKRIKGMYKSELEDFELTIFEKKGRTPSGDLGYIGKYRISKVEDVQTKVQETDVICWFTKRAQKQGQELSQELVAAAAKEQIQEQTPDTGTLQAAEGKAKKSVEKSPKKISKKATLPSESSEPSSKEISKPIEKSES